MTIDSEKPAGAEPLLRTTAGPVDAGGADGTIAADALPGSVGPAPKLVGTRAGLRVRTRVHRLGDLGFFSRQLVLVVIAVAVYFGVRHLTEGDAVAAVRHARWLIDVERSLGLYFELRLQESMLAITGMTQVVNFIYIWAHWPVIAAVLCWLAWRHRQAFFVYRNALLISGLVGMVIVATFPVAPPRLLDLGFVDTVTVHTEAYRVMQPPSLTNQYAAMPSFHAGWDLLMGIALVRYSSQFWLRAVGSALPLLMVFSIVVTGNHFVIDAIVGDAIVLVALAFSYWLHKRRTAPEREHGSIPAPGDRTRPAD